MVFRFQKLFQKGKKVGFVGQISEGKEALFFRFTEFGFRFGGGDLEKEEIPEVAGEVLGDPDRIAVAGAELVELAQSGGTVAREDGRGEGAGFDRAGEAEDFEDVIEGDVFSGEADELLKGGLGVPEAPLGLTGEEEEGFVGNFDFFRIGDFTEVGADQGIWDAAKVKTLAA